MTHDDQVVCVASTLIQRPALLRAVAEFLISDEGLLDDASHEIAESVCVETFGQRVPCRGDCGAMLLPGFKCWDCEEWTAPGP